MTSPSKKVTAQAKQLKAKTGFWTKTDLLLLKFRKMLTRAIHGVNT